MGKTEFHHF